VNLFSIEVAGEKGAGRPFPLHRKSPPKLLRFAPEQFQLRTLLAQSSRQRRFAPTAVHLRSGTPFGFPPESMFTFTGIPTSQIAH
jgi:hypothetical protein